MRRRVPGTGHAQMAAATDGSGAVARLPSIAQWPYPG
jgi:hypothetical protein